MKILVVGSGAREHALVWKIAQSARVGKIYCAPGNGGIASLAECVDIKADDIAGLLNFAKARSMDLTVVGPEVPLAEGIVDEFQKFHLRIFGPSKKAARLESSKAFAKEVMKECGVPTADFEICSTVPEVLSAAERLGLPVVLKADGLAAGKGVVICETHKAVKDTAQKILVDRTFGDAGQRVVVEACLVGEEASILVLTDGKQVLPLASSQDHKRVLDGDKGPNTGGMGAYSPTPLVTKALLEDVIKKIIQPVLAGLEARGALYQGVLYVGLMVTRKGPFVLEFNVRFGDPETQAVLLRLESDLLEALFWTIDGGLPPGLRWERRPSACVVLVSGGYPGSYEKGFEISGLDEVDRLRNIMVFHAGTQKTGSGPFVKYFTSGGRVLNVAALGEDLAGALGLAYDALGLIQFDKMHYRRDIGRKALKTD